jgi:hypothetical protein
MREGFPRPISAHAAMIEVSVRLGELPCRPIDVMTTLLAGLRGPEASQKARHGDRHGES